MLGRGTLPFLEGEVMPSPPFALPPPLLPWPALVCIVQGELLSQLAPVDICTIFGNALDNAIEGLSQVTDRETRTIQVKMAQEKGFLVIRFENPYAHDLNWVGTGLGTTKVDKLSHGYGLKGIMRSVDKYQGHMVIDTGNGKFVLTLLLPYGAATNHFCTFLRAKN